MRHIPRRITIAGLTALALAAAACGSPTPQGSTATAPPAGTPGAAPTTSRPDATATALFEATNRKLALGNEPTLAPGTDPLHPFANVTYPPEPTITPGPSPTPVGPECGETISGWPDILARYGQLTEKESGGCGPFKTSIGTQLIIMTRGLNGGPGAIATYLCQATDKNCLLGLPPQATGAAWSVHPAPFLGGVAEIGGASSPDTMILSGEYCFNLATHQYLSPGCH